MIYHLPCSGAALQAILATGEPHRIPPEDSLNQMRVIDALFESLATGKAVALAG
jgi:predicted dehydrogenase